jgi:ATP phosphoribosyltransferase regulatory subunit
MARLAVGVAETSAAESSTGFTLYMDSILRALPAAENAPRLYLPAAVAAQQGPNWRAQGWLTVAGLEERQGGREHALAEARRLQCSHALVDGKPIAVKE